MEKKDMWLIEKSHFDKGITCICGVDEAGRGPLAGPVCAAAVILPQGLVIEGLNDSKKISEKKRNILSEQIKQKALCYKIVEIDEKMIDEMNILQATRLGMKQAIEGLEIVPDIVLTDGTMTIDIAHKQKSVVHGDALSYSIGAASIIAKVHRDALMEEYAKVYEHYGFEKNKGYGTAEHIQGIKEHGLCPIHRKTFTKNF